MFEKFRIRRSQPKTVNPPIPGWAPGWLAVNQRSALRFVGVGLFLSLALNAYQTKKREDIEVKPPEVFVAMVDSTFTVVRTLRPDQINDEERELAAAAQVRSLIYRLRRVDSKEQMEEMKSMMSCNVMDAAAVKGMENFKRSTSTAILQKRWKRVVGERDINAGLRPGARPSDGGMWISATWIEVIDEGNKRTNLPQSGEFLVKKIDNLSPVVRACNPFGYMIVDYEIFQEGAV